MEISVDSYNSHDSNINRMPIQNNQHDNMISTHIAINSISQNLNTSYENISSCVNGSPPPYTSLTVELLETELWSLFSNVVNEMIVTRDGRRLFPVYKVKVIGLETNEMYKFELDFKLVESCRWKYGNGEWLKSTRAEVLTTSRKYTHPDSPNFGKFWSDTHVSFSRIKITNRESPNGSKIFLPSMHKYIPRLCIKKIDKNKSDIILGYFSFEETEFIAVTAYQNDEVTQLKVRYNPFAKAFQESNRKLDLFASHKNISSHTESNYNSFNYEQSKNHHYNDQYWGFPSYFTPNTYDFQHRTFRNNASAFDYNSQMPLGGGGSNSTIQTRNAYPPLLNNFNLYQFYPNNRFSFPIYNNNNNDTGSIPFDPYVNTMPFPRYTNTVAQSPTQSQIPPTNNSIRNENYCSLNVLAAIATQKSINELNLDDIPS
ncbi:hypothetical protein HZS_618, partial [Henneguya salminicola]